MRVMRTWFAAAALGTAMLMAGDTAHAQLPNISVWNFTGNCVDCALAAGQASYEVTATLTLEDYVGGRLGDENLVTFTYNGSNLFSAFTAGIGPQFGWGLGNFGNLTASSQSLYLIFGDVLTFTMDGNDWALCDFRTQAAAQTCNALSSADYGTGSFTLQSTQPPSTAVPEPGTYALMAAGLGALLLVRHRKRARAAI